MARKDLIPIERLRNLLRYNPDTGNLFWIARTPEDFPLSKMPQRACASWNSKYAGLPAGCDNGVGYISFHLEGRNFFAHRVAWAIYYGEWPKGCIDHINHDRSDNRICNLREVSKADNAKNMTLRRDSNSGVTGVSWVVRSNAWYANIWVDGKTINLGLFDKKEDAIAARRQAEERYGFYENHGTPRQAFSC